MSETTIIERLVRNAKNRPGEPALVRKVNGQWVPVTWRGYLDLVRTVGRALMALGMKPGQIVSILSNNRMEWVLSDLGALHAGGVSSGIYQTCTHDQVQYILGHSESPIVVVEDAQQLEKIRRRRPDLASLRWCILLDGKVSENDSEWVIHWNDFLELAHNTPEAALDERLAAIRPEHLATLIYTSGTTGNPKGVMLSHYNLVFTAEAIYNSAPRPEHPVILSYLPLSHIAEKMITVHLAITGMATVWFAESLEKVKDNLPDARPTLFFGVPRVWEKFQAALETRFSQATGIKARLLSFARSTAFAVQTERMQGREPSGMLALQYRLAHKLVLSKLHAALGLDQARMLVSGAAPISQSTLDFFLSLDLRINEVYGQSEGSGPTSSNRPVAFRKGTVGQVIPGAEIKIAADGEILLRGGNVFMGYYKQPEATVETLVDGWLHSGDVGEIDADGFLKITDRKKDLIITAGGKNISPQNLEKLLKALPEVAQAVVIGDRRKYLTALLTLKPDACQRWAAQHNIPFSTLSELIGHQSFVTHMKSQVQSVNEQLASYESIKQHTLLAEDFSLEGGELTPSMKIKRKSVNEKYSRQIEAMYTGHD